MTMNRTPDLRSTEGEPENIQTQSQFPRKHLRRTQGRERVRCILEGTSTRTRRLRGGPSRPLRLLAVVVQSETLGPMVLVELTSAMTWHLRGTGMQSAHRGPVGVRMKSASRNPAGAGTTAATATMAKTATEARASTGKGVENPKAEARGLTCPLADIPPHHLVEEVEAEAEVGDPVLAQNLPAMAHAMQGNVSTSRSEYIGPRCFGRMI